MRTFRLDTLPIILLPLFRFFFLSIFNHEIFERTSLLVTRNVSTRVKKKKKKEPFIVIHIERKLTKIYNPVRVANQSHIYETLFFRVITRNTTIHPLISSPSNNFRQRNEPVRPVKDHGRSVTPKRIAGREDKRRERKRERVTGDWRAD